MKEPDDAISGDRKNKIVIQVNAQTPTIEMLVNKNAGESFLLIRDKDLNPLVSVDSAGSHIQTDVKSPVNLTPGNALNVSTLTEGLQSHWFTLSAPWYEIVIEESSTHQGLRMIENLEIFRTSKYDSFKSLCKALGSL